MTVAQPVQPVPKKGRGTTKVLLIIATVLYALSLLPAGMLVITSPMIFDAGESPKLWTIFGLVVGYPVLVLLTLVVAWVLFVKKKYRAALIVSLLPILEVVTAVILMIL